MRHTFSAHAGFDACDRTARCVGARPQYDPAPVGSASPAQWPEELYQGPGCCRVFLEEAHG